MLVSAFSFLLGLPVCCFESCCLLSCLFCVSFWRLSLLREVAHFRQRRGWPWTRCYCCWNQGGQLFDLTLELSVLESFLGCRRGRDVPGSSRPELPGGSRTGRSRGTSWTPQNPEPGHGSLGQDGPRFRPSGHIKRWADSALDQEAGGLPLQRKRKGTPR
jgi:hypothetical protein